MSLLYLVQQPAGGSGAGGGIVVTVWPDSGGETAMGTGALSGSVVGGQTAASPCPVCYEPNPNYDPTNPYSSEPECIPSPAGTAVPGQPCKECDGSGSTTNKPDGVLKPCVSKHAEKQLGGRCVSDWVVGEWLEERVGPGISPNPFIQIEWMKRKRRIDFIEKTYECIFCITKYLKCVNGEVKEGDDWPGDMIGWDLIYPDDGEITQEEEFKRIWILWPPYKPPRYRDVPSPTPPPANPNPCRDPKAPTECRCP